MWRTSDYNTLINSVEIVYGNCNVVLIRIQSENQSPPVFCDYVIN